MTVGFIGGKFLPFHLGHAYAIVKASSMCDKLYVILSYGKERDYHLCVNEGNIKEIPYKVRLSWLRQFTRDMQNITVIAIEDSAKTNEGYDWEKGAKDIKLAIGENIDYIFSSEESYTAIFAKLYPKTKHMIIDEKRERYPISATKIRKEGPFKHWKFLPKIVRPFFVKKVVIVGTESCGKSTLIRNLSKIYNTNYVEEFGRTICEKKGGADALLEEDYPLIAYGHKMLEQNALESSNKILFIDTESLVTKYYLELYENKTSNLYEKIAKLQNYDLWIYLEPDVKWINDGTRTHGSQKIREENSTKLKNILDKQNVNYHIISGNYVERFSKAIELIENNIFNEKISN